MLGGHGREPRRIRERRPDPVDDRLAGHRESAVAQDGLEFGLVDRGLEGQERAQLRVAVLLHHEDRGVQAQEALHFVVEGKGLDAQIVDWNLLPREHIDRLAHRTVAAADAHDADLVVALADRSAVSARSAPRSRICA